MPDNYVLQSSQNPDPSSDLSQGAANALTPDPSITAPTTTSDVSNQIPTPDQSSPTPDPSDPQQAAPQQAAQPAKPSLWRSVLAGALQGLAAGGSVNTRGMSGGSAFAAGAGAGANQVLNVVPQQQSAQQQAALQSAFHHAQLAQIQREMALAPKDKHEQYLDNSASTYNDMLKSGAVVPLNQPTDFSTAQQTYQSLTLKNPAMTYSIMPTGRDDDGNFEYSAVQFPNAPTQADVTLTDPDGNKLVVPQGTKASAIGQNYTMLVSKALDRDSKETIASQNNATKTGIATQNNQTKTDIAAKKAAADNSANWLPKVSADEKKKAELAENIAFNANEVASIIQKRPDLFGPAAGRITNIEQMTGNNDPDISALATHIHNMAMANSGVHGFRSQEGVQSYENQLLNNFHNGPKAVAGALRASVGSVQTFIDNARPRTYKTHSANGGAIRGMMNQGGQ